MADSAGGFFIGKDTGDDYLQVQIGATSDGGGSWTSGSHSLGHSPVPTTDIPYVFIVSMKRDHNGYLTGRSSFNGGQTYKWVSNATTLPSGNWESQTIQIGQELNSRAFVGKIYQVAILNRGIAEFEVTDMFSVGAEIIPMDAIIDTKAATDADSHAKISDHKTIYVLASFGDMFYAKAGYSAADAEVVANYTTTTVTDAPDDISGPMVGIGAQLESPLPFLDVVRVEATYTDYGSMSITTTNTNLSLIHI